MRPIKFLKDSFLAGLLLVVPLVVTVIVLRFMANWAMIVIDPLVTGTRLATYTGNIQLIAQGIAVLSVVGTLVVLGTLSSHGWGRGFRARFGRFMGFVPFIGAIYLSVRQVVNSISDRNSRFKKLVVLEYPKEGVHSIGLLTSKAPEPLQKLSEEELYSIFLPNSPNPTGGRTVMVPEADFQEIDMTVHEGLKLMMTTGLAFEDHELPDNFRQI